MAWDPSPFDEACGTIVFNIACGCPAETDAVAQAIRELDPEGRQRLCHALVAVGALDAREALALLRNATNEDDRQATKAAGQPSGEERA
jgi:hypothetical protein